MPRAAARFPPTEIAPNPNPTKTQPKPLSHFSPSAAAKLDRLIAIPDSRIAIGDSIRLIRIGSGAADRIANNIDPYLSFIEAESGAIADRELALMSEAIAFDAIAPISAPCLHEVCSSGVHPVPVRSLWFSCFL